MEFLNQRLPWYIAGPALALIVVGLQWAANLPLGATGAIASLPTWLRGKEERGGAWRLLFFFGMIFGGFIFSQLTGGFHPSFAHGSFDSFISRGSFLIKVLVLTLAGFLIGFGARTAGGCTSGNGICGFSRGSKSSMVSTVVFVIAAVVTANLIRLVMGA